MSDRSNHDAFAGLADAPRWVMWREETRGGKPTKVPYAISGQHASATDPASWDTRAEAETRAPRFLNGHAGGIGVVLGDIGADTYLCGLDLDSCLDDGMPADWAADILAVAPSYCEVSPSGQGIKVFFYIESTAVRPFLNRIKVATDAWGCRRSVGISSGDHGPAIELYCAARYFAVTSQHWGQSSDQIALLDDAALDALAELIPSASSPGIGGNKTNGRDNSRSAKAFREAIRLKRGGRTYEEMREALLNHADPEIAAWAREKGLASNERELQRLWSRIGPSSRPIIKVGGGQLPDIVDEAEAILIASDRDLYEFGDRIVRPALEPIRIADNQKCTGLRLVPVGLHHMIERFTRAADFQRYNKKEKAWLSTDCPRPVAEAYLERVGSWNLPKLAAITACPVLLPDGRILDKPGFDAATGILFDPQGVTFPSVAQQPSRDDALAALAFLKGPFREFPFVDNVSRSVMWSALLSSVARLAFDFAPLHGFDAPAAGTGKSKLVDCCAILVTGHECAVISQGDCETEFEKRLGAMLLAGDRFLSIDNCNAPLGGQLLCQTATQPLLKIRVLGLSRMVLVVNGSLVFANGNNLQLLGDMLRRGLIAHLDAGVERPELRTFETEDPVRLLKRDRGRYVVAVLTVLHAYNIAGRPIEEDHPPDLGGFEGWSKLVRGALLWLGEADPVATMETARAEDPERLQLEAVITQWQAVLGDRSVTTSTVITEATQSKTTPEGHLEFLYPDFRNALLDVAGERGRIQPRRLGLWLGQQRHKVFGTHRLASDTVLHGLARWKLEQLQSDGTWR